LRGLAERATVFKNAFAVSDITLSTHASMFTGLYPRQHGAHCGERERIRESHWRRVLKTMAETLARRGYATMAVAANDVYLLPEWGLESRFRKVYDLHRPILVQAEFYGGVTPLLPQCSAPL